MKVSGSNSRALAQTYQRRPNGFAQFSIVVLLVSTTTISAITSTNRPGSTPDPAELVKAMSNSLRSLTYTGTFVVMSRGLVDTMKITHVNDGVNINEQLISLNGEAREIYRNNDFVTCIWPNSQSVINMKAKGRKLITSDNYVTSDSYQFRLIPDDRIAGRETYVVDVVAQDAQRFSYRLWIDKTTKMLLKSMSINKKYVPVEQLMFTNIRFDDLIAIDDLKNKLQRLDYSAEKFTKAVHPTTPVNSPVRFSFLPSGYRKVSDRYHPMPTLNDPVRHIFLSDGISSISVYVQFDYTSKESDVVGLSTLGAVTAYGRTEGASFITVMGEVPVQTVLGVAQAIEIDPNISYR